MPKSTKKTTKKPKQKNQTNKKINLRWCFVIISWKITPLKKCMAGTFNIAGEPYTNANLKTLIWKCSDAFTTMEEMTD